MIIKIVQQAPVGERFAPNEFFSQLGQQVPVDVEGYDTALLVSVDVAADGSSAELGVVLNDDPSLEGKHFGDTTYLEDNPAPIEEG